MFTTNLNTSDNQINGYYQYMNPSLMYQSQGMMFYYIPVYYPVMQQYPTLNDISYYDTIPWQNPSNPNNMYLTPSNLTEANNNIAVLNKQMNSKEVETPSASADKNFIEMFPRHSPCDSYGCFEKKQNNQNTMQGNITLSNTNQASLNECKTEDIEETNQKLPKTLPFSSFRYESLRMLSMTDHLLKPFDNLAEEFRKSKKGRKRRAYLKSDNMHEFIHDIFLPQWRKIMDQVSIREREIGVIQKGNLFVWVQLLKDVRRFYRLMFKSRFHRSDKRKDNNNRGNLVRCIITELGMETVEFDENEAYNFFYPVLAKLRKEVEPELTNNTPISKIYIENTYKNRDEFLMDGLCSQLLCFFILNFSEEYCSRMYHSFKNEVQTIINSLINKYTKQQE